MDAAQPDGIGDDSKNMVEAVAVDVCDADLTRFHMVVPSLHSCSDVGRGRRRRSGDIDDDLPEGTQESDDGASSATALRG
ncbi:MAG TPA: hypothetical protein VIT65_16425 [Microlunatus sp.]